MKNLERVSYKDFRKAVSKRRPSLLVQPYLIRVETFHPAGCFLCQEFVNISVKCRKATYVFVTNRGVVNLYGNKFTDEDIGTVFKLPNDPTWVTVEKFLASKYFEDWMTEEYNRHENEVRARIGEEACNG